MNNALDENLEKVLFERNAGKCATKADRIEFCHQYLQKHAPTSKNESDPFIGDPNPPGMALSAGLREDVWQLCARKTVDHYDLEKYTNNPQHFIESQIKPQIVSMLMRELVSRDYIKFNQERDMMLDRHLISGRIKVGIWK